MIKILLMTVRVMYFKIGVMKQSWTHKKTKLEEMDLLLILL